MKNTTKNSMTQQPSDKTKWAYWMQAIEPTSEAINKAFPGYHPQWVQLSQQRDLSSANFTGMRESLHITQEQCAVYLRVSPRTVRRWENGSIPVSFSAFELLRMVLKSVHARVSHTNWDGWFVSETGNLVSPDVGGEGFTPEQLNVLSFQRGEAPELRIENARLQALLDEAQAENTKLRQMYVAQGVVDELAAMQETINGLMLRIATARIIPFEVASTQPKKKTA
ncbi:MAG: VC1465 family Xer recombination activation factor [Gallionella sp.]|jgi:DNA-binding transcriptional regulator YiaG